MDQKLLEVYTDGRCPLCLWVRGRVEPHDTQGRLEWLDYHEPESQRRAAPHTPAELAAQMYVRRKSDGVWEKGYQAWLEVLKVLPRWSWLGRVLARQPFAALGPVLYRNVARRRYTLFGTPPPCDPSGVCSLHTSEK
ncbi:MAG: thiol-disulfide oxidoreductase DCC family protein [Pyrinomonadaceae bacterium]